MTKDSLRTLFITRAKPYPPVGGGPLRNWQNINIMKKYGTVGVFSLLKRNPSRIPIPDVALSYYCEADQPISLVEKWERELWWLRADGHPEVDQWYMKRIKLELDKVLTQFKPNLVIFEELWLYRYLKVVKRHNCSIIFDAYNIEVDLARQNYNTTKVLLPKLKFIEGNFIKQADQVWVCSEEDAKLLQELYGEKTKVYVIPNGVNLADYEIVRQRQCPLPDNIKDRQHTILFLGQYNYPPNQIAAELLLKQIYPYLKKDYPDCHLLLVGRNSTKTMREAATADPNIIVTDRVPDVRPYLSAASVMVVPLQQGGGTRLKILEAFAAGCPVISTSKGAEGIKGESGKHFIIKDDFEEIVAEIKKLWSNPNLGENLAKAAYELAQKEYSWEAVGNKVETAIAQFIKN